MCSKSCIQSFSKPHTSHPHSWEGRATDWLRCITHRNMKDCMHGCHERSSYEIYGERKRGNKEREDVWMRRERTVQRWPWAHRRCPRLHWHKCTESLDSRLQCLQQLRVQSLSWEANETNIYCRQFVQEHTVWFSTICLGWWITVLREIIQNT